MTSQADRNTTDFSTIFWDNDSEAFFFVDDSGVTACGDTREACINDYMVQVSGKAVVQQATTSQTANIEKFNTVQEAVTAIRMRVWGQAKAKNCGYKIRTDGACTMYTFMVGRITWKAYFDNYGRAVTERA